LLAEDFWAVVAAPKAGPDDWAIREERPKPVRSRASKSFFNVGREFIVLFVSSVIALKIQIF
jgi:hypothetical protein